jgi:hypothetical protein
MQQRTLIMMKVPRRPASRAPLAVGSSRLNLMSHATKVTRTSRQILSSAMAHVLTRESIDGRGAMPAWSPVEMRSSNPGVQYA